MKRYITILLCMITGFLSFSSCDDKNDPDTIKGDRELYLSALVDGLGIDAATYRFQGGHGVGFWLSSTDVNGNLNQADIAVNNQFLQSAGGLVSEPRTNWSKSGKFSYISKFHIIISCKLIVYIVMCFYQETN